MEIEQLYQLLKFMYEMKNNLYLGLGDETIQ